MSLCVYAKLLLFRHEAADVRGDMAPLYLKLVTVFSPWSICAKESDQGRN